MKVQGIMRYLGKVAIKNVLQKNQDKEKIIPIYAKLFALLIDHLKW
jgi:hypothetical protein